MWPISILSWFGEQTEAVKLALIAAFSATAAGVISVVKEWRKPVLNTSTDNAVKQIHDHPVSVLSVGIEALTVQIMELRKQLEQLETENRNLREAINIARVSLSKS